jgi:demethylmenaquinone methyltransferase / 2-methoxy-6-polyprenyl-1,4-benzoquinol methylase
MSISADPVTPSSLPDRALVRDLFDWLAPKYDGAVTAYSLGQDLRWKWVLLQELAPRKGERALDLASGTGLIYERLEARLGPGRVVGLDINRTMLRGSRRRDRGRRLVMADSVRLPFADESFDLVTAGYLFKYVALDRLAKELRRVLRPGGRFAGYDFSAPTPSSPSGLAYSVFLQRLLPILGRRPSPRPGWDRLFRFLERLATTSGWEDRIVPALEATGFTGIRRRSALGGPVTWVWACRPE